MAGAGVLYEGLLKPLLFRVDPERAHHAASWGLELVTRTSRGRELLECSLGGGDGRLGVTAFGLAFGNPLGVAGGFDKDARLMPALAALGFGHVEIGTVTPRPQPGNPRPRIFRLPADHALVNRMGFPSAGAAAVAGRLAASPRPAIPVLASLGKNKDTPPERAADDFVACLRALHQHADGFTVNVSSPNTPGLRDLGVGAALETILVAVVGASRELAAARGEAPKPVLVKLSPDLADEDLADAVESSLDLGVRGFVAVNTTVMRDGLGSTSAESRETGGLSGAPLAARALEVVRWIHRKAGDRARIVGVGGVQSGADAYRLIRAGATLVQAYTGFVYRGPGFAKAVKSELRECLAREGFATVADAVGTDG